MTTIYISGPMTGIPDFNYPAFNAAAKAIRSLGYEVLNPAENFDGRSDLLRESYMRLDIQHVLSADAVAVLPGWQRSRGATLEVAIARELGLPILDAETLDPFAESALEEAQRLVHGDRGDAYGHPIEDFSRTAAIWSALLGATVTAEDVGRCMIGVKLSREVNKAGRDNRVDIAGYAETLNMIAERRAATSDASGSRPADG